VRVKWGKVRNGRGKYKSVRGGGRDFIKDPGWTIYGFGKKNIMRISRVDNGGRKEK